MKVLSASAGRAELQAGHALLFDTDTLPGLHALAQQDGAAELLRTLKGYTSNRPWLLLVPSVDVAFAIGRPASPAQADELRALWPAPLTALLIPARDCPAGWTDSGRTVAVRVPGSAALREFLTGLDGPLFSTSANQGGDEPAEDLATAAARFPGVGVVSFGTTPAAAASTIVDFTVNPANLVRPGIVAYGPEFRGDGVA